MGKAIGRLEDVRRAYRDALEAARAQPNAETWAKLLAAGKELSAKEEPRKSARQRRSKNSIPTIQELEGPLPEAQEPELRELEAE